MGVVCWGKISANMLGKISAQQTLPVTKFPKVVKSFGIWDMCGNVREWVSGWYGANYYDEARRRTPKAPLTKC